MSKYKDIYGNEYDEIPEGFHFLATNEEIELYHSDNPVLFKRINCKT